MTGVQALHNRKVPCYYSACRGSFADGATLSCRNVERDQGDNGLCFPRRASGRRDRKSTNYRRCARTFEFMCRTWLTSTMRHVRLQCAESTEQARRNCAIPCVSHPSFRSASTSSCRWRTSCIFIRNGWRHLSGGGEGKGGSCL